MISVTAFRHVPRPLIGMVNGVNDPKFAELEASLDWLECTGVLVDRVDPTIATGEVAKHPGAREALAKGDDHLPLLLVDETVVFEGAYPSRSQLARAVGRARMAGKPEGGPAV